MKIGIIGAMHEEIMELKNSMKNINLDYVFGYTGGKEAE